MNNNENLFKRRHSLSHLLAIVILKEYPKAKLAIGPAIDTGFYYDFDFSEGKTPSSEELNKLTEKVKELVKKDIAFVKKDISTEEAKKLFKDNSYKMELIEELISNNQPLTVYQSEEFIDLCAGPHVESTKEIDPESFKISSIAGAYWRGDEKNKQLTRIYGLAFNNKEELDEYIKNKEQAVERDHRKIGKEMNLFAFSDLVGSGLPLFTPNGTAMRDAIVSKIETLQKRHRYQKVWIPHITKPDLYKVSGHWEKFGDELFKVKGRESEFVMKPMNCPHHCQIYASAPKSYKDLPVRYMETTTVYRDEQSGELLGISRVRSLTQDDGHIFCTPEQIKQEIVTIISIIKEFYSALGLWKTDSYRLSLSVRDPKAPEKYLGGDDVWQKAEGALKDSAEEAGLKYDIAEGDAAFYGPKLDFRFKDAIGREWQLATVQLDFNMPTRFGLEYTDKDGSKKTPVMIHRAIAGSLERFLSVIIEHFAGEFPLWIAPVQIRILPVKETVNEYASSIADYLISKGLRVEIELSDENLGKKVKKAKQDKVPYYLVIGEKEKDSNTVTVEKGFGQNEKTPATLSAEDFFDLIKPEL